VRKAVQKSKHFSLLNGAVNYVVIFMLRLATAL
jgi:hypothetical protein